MADDNCIFCEIANGVIPSTTLYGDEQFRVILGLGPASKGHALILSKQHPADVYTLDEGTASKTLPLGTKAGAAMKKPLGCTRSNLVQNDGGSARQTIFHFHVHAIPRCENGPPIVGWIPDNAILEELVQTTE